MTDNLRGILLMCGSMAAFTLNDSCMKAVTESLPLFQAIALRGALATAGLLLVGRLAGGRVTLWPAPADRGRVALRTLAELGATAFFLTALVHLPLANLSAILQALPLAIPLGARLVLGEPLGWRQVVAIAAGFGGVMVILRPGGAGFDHWSLLGLASVACVVVRDLSTRRMTAATPSVTVAVWASVAVTGMGAVVAMAQGWQAMTPAQAGLIGLAATALVCGYLLAVMVMRVGDIALVAPFRYTSFLWAILLGWLVFADLPDRWTVLGAAIVVATGIYTLWQARPAPRQAACAPGQGQG